MRGDTQNRCSDLSRNAALQVGSGSRHPQLRCRGLGRPANLGLARLRGLAGDGPEGCQRARVMAERHGGAMLRTDLRMDAGRLAGVRVGWRNERGSAGAKRPPSWVTIRRPSGARVRCSVSAEGATSSSAGLRSHPAAFRAPGCRRSGPSTAALLVGVSGAAARRASVRDVATAAQPRSPAPESEESYPRNDAANGEQRRLNRATNLAPRQTLSCCVPLSGKAARSMRAAETAGIRFTPGW